MDIHDWLQSIVSDCSLLSTTEEAISLVPDIGVDAPLLVPLPIEGQGQHKAFPSVCAEALREPLAKLISAQLAAWKAGTAQDAVALSKPERLADDPLVMLVAELISEAWQHDRRLTTGLMLEIARQTSLLSSGRVEEWGNNATLVGTARLAKELAGLDAAARAQGYRALTWAVSARLSAAWSLAAQLDRAVAPSRFFQAMITNKLVFTHPAGSLDSAEHLGLIAALEGVGIEEERLFGAYLAVKTALEQVLAGGDDAISQSVRDLFGSRNNASVMALDPSLAIPVLHNLEDLLDAKAMKDAGLSKKDTKALQKGPGLAAICAAYTRCTRALRAWDLLSAAAARSLPITPKGGGADTRLGKLVPSAAWGLMVPRGGSVKTATVVALDLSPLYRFVAERSAQSRGLGLGLAAWRANLARQARQLEGIGGAASGFDLYAFHHPGGAEGFLRQIQDSLTAIHLERGPFGRPVPVPSNLWIRAHTATGPVLGGWDGGALRLWGPAVDEACFGAAGQRDPQSLEDSLGDLDPLASLGGMLAAGAAKSKGAPLAAIDPFSQEIPAPAANPPRGSDPPVEDPFAPETYTLESPDGDEEEGEDFGNPFDDEARTVVTDIGTLRASAENPTPLTALVLEVLTFDDDDEQATVLERAHPEDIDEDTDQGVREDAEEEASEDWLDEAPLIQASFSAVGGELLETAPEEDELDEDVPSDAIMMRFGASPEPLEQDVSEEQEWEEPVQLDFEEELEPAPPEPPSLPEEEELVEEEEVLLEEAVLLEEEELVEEEEAVLVEEEDHEVLDSVSESYQSLEILDDDEEYEVDSDEESGDPNTNLDGEYFLPGDVAPPEEEPADGELVEEDYFLPPPERHVDEPTKDEVTFDVPLTRAQAEPEEESEDSHTFDFAFELEGQTEGSADAPSASETHPSGQAILQLDEDLGDGELDLPGEPDEEGDFVEEEFVLDELSAHLSSGANGGVSSGSSSGLHWIDKASPEEEVAESYTSEDSMSGMASLPDLEYLFQGYVVFTEETGAVCFGRRYGRRLLDVHSYEVSGRLSPAYQSFLNDKVLEGFVPRADLTRPMPKDIPIQDVDLEEMGRAFRVLAAR